jgi:cytochrome bd-type quinol oxidase subunit 2
MHTLQLWLADASTSILGGLNAACSSSCNKKDLSAVFTNVANTLTYIVGAVSVIMIIVGGFRYVMSQGDSKTAAEAKNTILYAVIGVVVAITAYAIINFVIVSIK